MNRPSAPSARPLLSFSRGKTLLLAAAAALAVAYLAPSAVAEKAVIIPAPAGEAAASMPATAAATQTAVFAGGCFWGIQAVFQHTKGVLNAVSGYAGGQKADADYDRVSTGRTQHAESVQVTFDPKQVSFGQLLHIYFSVAHDPTQLNRQYPDTGPQYRSAVFYQDAGQKQQAERYIAQLDAAKVFPNKIVTQLSPMTGFFPAEAYHQNYATLHPESGYIAQFDLPKIANLKAVMPTLYRETPVLVGAKTAG